MPAIAQQEAVRDGRITGIFVSLSRVMPDRYPLAEELPWYLENERGFGRILDLGMIQPRLRVLYRWSASELSIPEPSGLVQDGVPTCAWDTNDAEPWGPSTGWTARAARTVLPAAGHRR
jgi:hypothetical protein